MKRSLAFAMLFLSTAALAAPGVDPFTGGDPEAGATKAAACMACHGPGGNSTNPEWPKLAGQHGKYLVYQMGVIKSGLRPIPVMGGQLDNITEQDFMDIAAYFAAQPPTPGVGSPDSLAIADPLYRIGDPARGLPACGSCHGPKGTGNAGAGYPRLGGQHATYLSKALRDLQGLHGALASGALKLPDQNPKTMAEIASKLTDAEIDALASYLNGLN